MRRSWPFKGNFKLATLYGTKGPMWQIGWHTGLDIISTDANGDGRVYSIAEGVVQSINAHGPSYGNHVAIRHPDGHISLYAHLERILVKAGQSVNSDTQLGVEGTTGNSTGVHLHLEIHNKAYKYPAEIDPKAFIEEGMEEEDKDMVIYKTLADIPSWGKPTVQRLVNRGSLKGNEKGELNMSEDMLRILVILDREKVFK